MKQITAFECGHCRKIYRTERGVNKHQQFCTRNPENNHHCGSCKHFKEEKVMRPYYGDFENLVEGTRFRCGKFDKILYSASMEGKGYLKKYPGQFIDAMKMPNDCKEFEWQEF